MNVFAAKALKDDATGSVTNIDGTNSAVLRFATTVADKTVTGHVEAMALYASKSVGAVTRLMPAQEIVHDDGADKRGSVPDG